MNMENTRISKYTISFGLSLALASVMNALLVVAKEKIPTVMAGLQSTDRPSLGFSWRHRPGPLCRVRLDFRTGQWRLWDQGFRSTA